MLFCFILDLNSCKINSLFINKDKLCKQLFRDKLALIVKGFLIKIALIEVLTNPEK